MSILLQLQNYIRADWLEQSDAWFVEDFPTSCQIMVKA
jgi:hypothetical protein